MQDYRFRKGDRVMTHTPLMHIPVGTRGTVVMVYFVVDDTAVVVLAVLHVSRNPAEWQRRRD